MPDITGQTKLLLDKVGGELLEGSGFEDETPDSRFVPMFIDATDDRPERLSP